jgi:hypothetical protein
MELKSLDEFRRVILKKHLDGHLVTPKHNPFFMINGLPAPNTSVISFEFLMNPREFIYDYISEVHLFTNVIHGSDYYEVVPTGGNYGFFSSGTTGMQIVVLEGWDRMVCVKGWKQGIHAFGEKSDRIWKKQKNHQLIHKYKLK